MATTISLTKLSPTHFSLELPADSNQHANVPLRTVRAEKRLLRRPATRIFRETSAGDALVTLRRNSVLLHGKEHKVSDLVFSKDKYGYPYWFHAVSNGRDYSFQKRTDSNDFDLIADDEKTALATFTGKTPDKSFSTISLRPTATDLTSDHALLVRDEPTSLFDQTIAMLIVVQALREKDWRGTLDSEPGADETITPSSLHIFFFWAIGLGDIAAGFERGRGL